jgi:hypothetical protein
MLKPKTFAVPNVGFLIQARISTVVVLPEPFGPKYEKISP